MKLNVSVDAIGIMDAADPSASIMLTLLLGDVTVHKLVSAAWNASRFSPVDQDMLPFVYTSHAVSEMLLYFALIPACYWDHVVDAGFANSVALIVVLVAMLVGELEFIVSEWVSRVLVCMVGRRRAMTDVDALLWECGSVSRITQIIDCSILAPISEELFFRCFVFVAARDAMGTTFAIFYSAVVFAIMHGRVRHSVPDFILATCCGPLCLGLVNGLVFAAYDNLWPVVTIHAMHNLLCDTPVILDVAKCLLWGRQKDADTDE